MYGPLLMFIICLPLLAIAIFFGVAPYKFYCKYDKQCYYYDARPFHQENEYFHNSDYELRILRETGQEDKIPTLQKIYKKQRFWYAFWSKSEIWLGVLIAVLALAVVAFGCWALLEPMLVAQDIAYWEEFAPMAQEIFNSANDYERVAIADKIVEYNTWIAEAKASQKFWGNWSSYYGVDLSQLQMITLGGQ